MKYCIYKDQPIPTWAGGEQVLTGCEIFGVHHNCEGCPNLKEMGDNPYNSFSTIEEKNKIDKGFTEFIQNGLELEKEIDKYFAGWDTDAEYGDAVKPDCYGCSLDDCKDIARHFYKFGKARKEEKK